MERRVTLLKVVFANAPAHNSEEAIEAVAESSQDHSTPDFGTNQWLVEEMYERFRNDPASVDATWVTFFQTGEGAAMANGSGNGTSPNGAASTSAASAPPAAAGEQSAAPAETTAPSPAPTAPTSSTPPAPKTQPVTVTPAQSQVAAPAHVDPPTPCRRWSMPPPRPPRSPRPTEGR